MIKETMEGKAKVGSMPYVGEDPDSV